MTQAMNDSTAPVSVTDAPEWVLTSFVRNVLAAGATASREEIERVGRRLLERWQEPGRAFHNVEHLTAVLTRIDELAEQTDMPEAVRLAAWYHGAVFSTAALVVYARRGGEDALAGASLAGEELAELGVPATTIGRVHDLIEGLHRHEADHDDVEALTLCDAHLGTLAVEPGHYEAYRAAIRQEYAHIAEEDYVGARLAIVTKLLARRRLFVSPFTLDWEQPARENLTAELGRLRMRLTALDGTPRPEPAALTGRDDEVGATADGGIESEPDTYADADADADQDAIAALAEIDVDAEADACRFGIEREPELDPRRRRERRRRRPLRQGPLAPPSVTEDDDSTGTLFRPPPRLPRT